jgi:hypothetical protein
MQVRNTIKCKGTRGVNSHRSQSSSRTMASPACRPEQFYPLRTASPEHLKALRVESLLDGSTQFASVCESLDRSPICNSFQYYPTQNINAGKSNLVPTPGPASR